jgi:hypothetical protein
MSTQALLSEKDGEKPDGNSPSNSNNEKNDLNSTQYSMSGERQSEEGETNYQHLNTIVFNTTCVTTITITIYCD